MYYSCNHQKTTHMEDEENVQGYWNQKCNNDIIYYTL